MERKKKRKKHVSFKRIFLLAFVVIVCIILGVGCGLVAGAAKQMPKAITPQPPMTTTVLDAKGNVIAQLHTVGGNRVPVKLSQIPKNMQYATIAIEDARFEHHFGIDLQGLARAIFVDITTMSRKEGASTITQQLARNAFLTQDKTFSRKIKEAILAIQLERRYTKSQILEFYLNQVYYGSGADGVEMASRIYFGKDIKDLDLSECALLAGIPKSPTHYSPYNDMDAAISRRNLVLDKMVEQGYITASQAQEAKNEKIKLAGLKESENNINHAPYFTDYVVSELEKAGFTEDQIYKGGLTIYTTLDLKMQNAAEKAVQESMSSGVLRGEKDNNGITQPQVAVLTLDPGNGYIKAMIGGRDYSETKFNRTVQAVRQPGSAFKPFVYITALNDGYTPATVIDDKPVSYGGWSPQNYGGGHEGPVTLTRAIQGSINTVAVQLMDQVGIDNVINTAEKMGISTLVKNGAKNDRQLAAALGGLTRGVIPMELTAAYGSLANGGIYSQPMAIVKVEDKDGNILYEGKPQHREVLSADTAYLMTSMLKNVVTSGGTGARANIGRPMAGKTGTTSDYTDAWFVGYTPDLVTSVWLGTDQNPKGNTYMRRHKISSSYAAGLWGKYMRQAVAGTTAHDFFKPDNIIGPIMVNKYSGQLASDLSIPGTALPMYFLEGTAPSEYDSSQNGTTTPDGTTPGDGTTPPDGAIPPDGTVPPESTTPSDGTTVPSNEQPSGDTGDGNASTMNPDNGGKSQDQYVYVLIDPQTGYLATDKCPVTKLKRFKVGEQPTQYCPIHQK